MNNLNEIPVGASDAIQRREDRIRELLERLPRVPDLPSTEGQAEAKQAAKVETKTVEPVVEEKFPKNSDFKKIKKVTAKDCQKYCANPNCDEIVNEDGKSQKYSDLSFFVRKRGHRTNQKKFCQKCEKKI